MQSLIIIGMISLQLAAASARPDDPPKAQGSGPVSKPARPRAPADYVNFESDKAGAFFIPKALNDQYEALIRRLAELRSDIAQAKVDAAEARDRLSALDRDLQALQKRIEDVKFYVPGVGVQTQSLAETIAIAAGESLFIECGNIEIRGWDQPGIQCVLHKTVLGDDAAEAAKDFQGIELVVRKTKGSELFGFYQGIADKAEWKAEWEQFPFKDFLKREFLMISLKGLNHEEGNRQMTLEMKNEAGQGLLSSQWRRHGKLTIFMPKGHHLGVRGGLEGFKVQGLGGPLSVQGQGNRDYQAVFSATDCDGPITADHFPLHRAETIRGSVTVRSTAYNEDSQTLHGPQGVQMRASAPKESIYREIQGDLRLRFCRADVTIERTRGQLDVENDFGRTTIALAGLDAAKPHRVVAESGSIEIQLPAGVAILSKLPLMMLTECGSTSFPPALRSRLEAQHFSYSLGHDRRRAWQGFISKPDKTDPQPAPRGFQLFDRVNQTLQGQPSERPTSPGLDVLNRGGTIRVSIADGAAKAAP